MMRQCAFCPSTKLTQEHIWGDWINGILPPNTTFTTRRTTNPAGEFIEWKTEGINQTAKIVCAACNNGWMSDLENNEAKPTMSDMIRYGGYVSILPRGVASIAAFGFKMMVIANHIGMLKNKPYFCARERYDFARTLEVPFGVQIWMFALSTPGRVTGKFNSHFGRLPSHIKCGFELYIGTFAIGYLGIQVVASRWANPHLSTFLGGFPGFREPQRWKDATVSLFPSDGSPVLWPPPLHLGSDSIDEFCLRWKDLNVPSWMISGSPD
jgi:hypothetical protein